MTVDLKYSLNLNFKTVDEGLHLLERQYNLLGWDVESVFARVLTQTDHAFLTPALDALHNNLIFSIRQAPPGVDTTPLIGINRLIDAIRKVFKIEDSAGSSRSSLLSLWEKSKESFDFDQLSKDGPDYSLPGTEEMDAELAEAFSKEHYSAPMDSEWKPSLYTPSKWYEEMVLKKTEKPAPTPGDGTPATSYQMPSPIDTIYEGIREILSEDRNIESCMSSSTDVGSNPPMTTPLNSEVPQVTPSSSTEPSSPSEV
jgi:hypothetical protein